MLKRPFSFLLLFSALLCFLYPCLAAQAPANTVKINFDGYDVFEYDAFQKFTVELNGRFDLLSELLNGLQNKSSSVNNCWFVLLSGWQRAPDTEYIYRAQTAWLEEEMEGLSLDDNVWSEPIDVAGGIQHRIALLVIIDKAACATKESIKRLLGEMAVKISIEKSDAMSTEADMLITSGGTDSVKLRHPGFTPEEYGVFINALERAHIDDLENNDHYFARRLGDVENVCVWKLTLSVKMPWEIGCAFGFYDAKADLSIAYFNDVDTYGFRKLDGSNESFLVVGYSGDEPSYSDVIAMLKEACLHYWVSPEPPLIGAGILGPYYGMDVGACLR